MAFCDEKYFTSSLTATFRASGLQSLLTRERTELFYRLCEHMLTVNESFNLTAITEPHKIILHHLADCAALARELPQGKRVIDVGCGGGFPTLPLAILRPDLSILAIDSTAKKVTYVAETASLLGLKNVETQAVRAEDLSKRPEMREQFDIATARAVAELRILAELCLPFVKVGGQMVAMKGKNAQFELTAAKRAVATLGARLGEVKEITLTNGDEVLSHPLIFIAKSAKTPSAYPRPYAQIQKKPL